MEDRHQETRQLDIDGLLEKASGRQVVRNTVAHRLQSFFVSLRANFPGDAEAILVRAEQHAATRQY